VFESSQSSGSALSSTALPVCSLSVSWPLGPVHHDGIMECTMQLGNALSTLLWCLCIITLHWSHCTRLSIWAHIAHTHMSFKTYKAMVHRESSETRSHRLSDGEGMVMVLVTELRRESH